MQFDNIVSSWRNGADSVRGFDNPAGPLYTDGVNAIEAAMTNPNNADTMLSRTALTCLPPFDPHCFCN
jgi:hypothetical protein